MGLLKARGHSCRQFCVLSIPCWMGVGPTGHRGGCFAFPGGGAAIFQGRNPKAAAGSGCGVGIISEAEAGGDGCGFRRRAMWLGIGP